MIMSVCECVCACVPKHLSAGELVEKLLGNPQAGFSVERCIEGYARRSSSQAVNERSLLLSFTNFLGKYPQNVPLQGKACILSKFYSVTKIRTKLGKKVFSE